MDLVSISKVDMSHRKSRFYLGSPENASENRASSTTEKFF